MKNSCTKVSTLIGGVVIALTMVGCASTPPSADFMTKPPEQQRVDANDVATIKLEASNDVEIMDTEKQRLSELILSKIDAKKKENTNAADPMQYEFDVLITRYDKGNALKLILPVLGRIHIDAHVTVLSLPTRAKYAEFDINKTNAWGGTGSKIWHLEEGFAKGIANAVVESQQ